MFLVSLLVLYALPIITYSDAQVENCKVQVGPTCTNCSDGYYLLEDYNECLKCYETCKTCVPRNIYDYPYNEPQDSDCMSCNDGYYEYSFMDFNGFYSGFCTECGINNCKVCQKDDDSIKCNKCFPNFYVNSGQCSSCHSSCLECNGPNENQCTGCVDGFGVHQTTEGSFCEKCPDNCLECDKDLKCTKCIENSYTDSQGDCQKCDPSCDGCYNGGNNNCIKCKDGYFDQEGTCLICDTSCKTCETSNTHCTDCKDGFYLSDSTCVACDSPHCKKCTSFWCEECEDGYYRDNNLGCSKCDDECFTCTQGNPEKCTQCSNGYYPYQFYDGFFYCTKCSYPCLNCSASDNCQLCKEGFYVSNGKCESCGSNCLFCDNNGQCQECKEGHYLSGNTCTPCPSNCKNCSSSGCMECYDGYFVSDTGCSECGDNCKQCSSKDHCLKCKDKFFVNENNACSPCADPNCDECNATHCLDCIPEHYVKEDGTCAKCAVVCSECDGPTENDCLDCDPGYYFSRTSRRCFKCNEACSVCDGPNDYNCSECAFGYFMDEDSAILPDGTKGKKCTKCEFGCLECTSLTLCTECKEGYTASGYDDCKQCPNGCKSCLATSLDCTSCLPGYFSTNKDNGYVSCSKCPGNCADCSTTDSGIVCNTCSDGFYKDTEGKCVQCKYPCATCDSETVCKSCAERHLLKGGSCDTQCTGNCLTCVDEPDICLSCYEGSSLKEKTCEYCGYGCKTCDFQKESPVCTSCLDGFYLEEGQCMQCSSECATCFTTGSSYCFACSKGYFKQREFSFPAPYRGQCTSCNDTEKGLPHCSECTSFCSDDDIGHGGECTFSCTNCDDGFYLSEDGKSCLDCDKSCKTCYGAGPNRCRTCHDGEFNQDDQCVQCLTDCKVCTNLSVCIQCNDGYQLKDEGQKCEKIPCSANCLLCDTKNCLQCEEGYGQDWDTSAGGFRCKDCSIEETNCKTCEKNSEDKLKCTSCQTGYYLDSLQYCRSCPTNCEVCTGSDNCQVCHAGYYVSEGKECKECTNNCATCSISSDNCTSCPDGFMEVGNTCQGCPSNCKECNKEGCVTCNEHYYETGGTCEECGTKCLHCKDRTTCTDCELHYYADGQGTCQECGNNCDKCESKEKCTDCYPEYFVSEDGSCQKCAEVCHECSGPTENDCLDCDEGYYLSKPNKKCFKCHEGCKNCTGPNDYECSICSTGYFMSDKIIEYGPGVYGKPCIRCENGCAECSSLTQCIVCKGGFYLVNNNGDMDCEPCETGCDKCDSGSTKCSSCSEGYYISETYEGALVKCSECPNHCKSCKSESGTVTCLTCFEGFYENPETNNCDSCKYPCATCSSSATSCLSCADNYLLKGDKCDESCKYPCLTCKDDPNNCLTCYDKYTPSNTTCIECPEGCKSCEKVDEVFTCTSCIDGYYKDGEQCKKCNSPCSTCFSENSYRCFSCIEGYYIDRIFTDPVPYGGQCQECSYKAEHCLECSTECIDDDLDSYKTCHNFKCSKCESGYFVSEENGQSACSPCISNCETCTDSSTCLKCKEGYQLKDEGKTCEKIPCSSDCDLCDTQNCIECKEGYGKYWDNEAVGYRCKECSQFILNCKKCETQSSSVLCTACELGYYPDSVGICRNCPTNCEVCTGSDNCQVCHAGYYVSEGKECKECTNNCATCSISSDNCTSCPDGFMEVGNTCQGCPSNCKECNKEGCVTCNEHYYETGGTCEECGTKCLHCKDRTTCTDCELHYYADGQGTCQECGNNCDKCESKEKCTDCYPEYFVSEDGSCQKCAEVCHECSGPTENDCLDCDEGYYLSKPNKKCFKCHEGCKNCTGPNDYECSICSTGYFMSDGDTEILPGIKGKKCTRCENGCAECSSLTQCIVCKGGFYLVNNNGDMDCEPCETGCDKCDSGSTKCSSCSEGYYISETYEGALVKCSECPNHCKSCKSESGTVTCLTCFEGFYENPETHNCDSCKYPCATCSSSATSCLSCADNYLLEGDTCNTMCTYPCMTCKDKADNCVTCYDEYVPSGTTCVKCPEGCKTCETVDEVFSCTSCLDGYYKDQEQCKSCNSPCSTCFNSYSCFTCEQGYYIDKIFTVPAAYVATCAECGSRIAHCSECQSECIDDDLDSYSSCGNFKCTNCESGFFVSEENGQQACSSCPSNCNICTDAVTCKECNKGYILNGTLCEALNDLCNNGHCELDNTNSSSYTNLTLSPELVPSFNGSTNEESGGAVRLVNSGLTCINLSFTGCKSQKGGGGVYIYNNIKTEDESATYSISFTGLTFERCEASYGAAVFIYSPSETSPVQITSCIFESNQLSYSSSSSNKFYGGSALYIVSKNSEIVDCTFSRNKGRGGAVKISTDFSVVPDGLRVLQRMSNNSQGSILISGCSFEIDGDSDSSLFYDNERRSAKIEIKECSFGGKLGKGAHHIDGISVDSERSDLLINSCKFASDQNGALNNKFIKIDLRNQLTFNNNEYIKKQMNTKLMMMVSSLATVLVIVITIIFKKQNNNDSENQESIEA